MTLKLRPKSGVGGTEYYFILFTDEILELVESFLAYLIASLMPSYILMETHENPILVVN